MDKDYNDIVAFQTRRVLNVLAKKMLVLIEDLKTEHQIHFDKLRVSMPPESQAVIEQADYLDDQKFSYLRKKILDNAGEGWREIEQELSKYHFGLKH